MYGSRWEGNWVLGVEKGIGSAVHNSSTGSENCCEPRRRQGTFYTKVSTICGGKASPAVQPGPDHHITLTHRPAKCQGL